MVSSVSGFNLRASEFNCSEFSNHCDLVASVFHFLMIFNGTHYVINAINYCEILFNNNKSIQTLVVAYNKLNFNNILESNAKKIEFKLNLLLYNIHIQHANQKTLEKKERRHLTV